jgi:hypothetical protein
MIAYNMKRCLRFFLVSYFEYHQIWLNILMDSHNFLSIITILVTNFMELLLMKTWETRCFIQGSFIFAADLPLLFS